MLQEKKTIYLMNIFAKVLNYQQMKSTYIKHDIPQSIQYAKISVIHYYNNLKKKNNMILSIYDPLKPLETIQYSFMTKTQKTEIEWNFLNLKKVQLQAELYSPKIHILKP